MLFAACWLILDQGASPTVGPVSRYWMMDGAKACVGNKAAGQKDTNCMFESWLCL